MDGTRVRLRVAPGARRSGVVGRHGDAWKVAVSAPPTDGRANDAVVALLADALGVPPSSVQLVSGHAAREKTVTLTGLDAREVERRLEVAAKR